MNFYPEKRGACVMAAAVRVSICGGGMSLLFAYAAARHFGWL
jgi:hypothetical protein